MDGGGRRGGKALGGSGAGFIIRGRRGGRGPGWAAWVLATWTGAAAGSGESPPLAVPLDPVSQAEGLQTVVQGEELDTAIVRLAQTADGCAGTRAFLGQRLRDPDPRWRRLAVRALSRGAAWETREHLRAWLTTPPSHPDDVAGRALARCQLALTGPRPGDLAALLAPLRDAGEALAERRSALTALALLAPRLESADAAELLDALLPVLLQGEDASTRCGVATVLSRVTTDDRAAVALGVAASSDTETSVRRAAAEGLCRLAEEGA